MNFWKITFKEHPREKKTLKVLNIVDAASGMHIPIQTDRRSRPMRGNYVPGDLVYYWRAGNGVHQAHGQWLGPARVIGIEGGNVWVSHRATAIKCAKEQPRRA